MSYPSQEENSQITKDESVSSRIVRMSPSKVRLGEWTLGQFMYGFGAYLPMPVLDPVTIATCLGSDRESIALKQEWLRNPRNESANYLEEWCRRTLRGGGSDVTTCNSFWWPLLTTQFSWQHFSDSMSWSIQTATSHHLIRWPSNRSFTSSWNLQTGLYWRFRRRRGRRTLDLFQGWFE